MYYVHTSHHAATLPPPCIACSSQVYSWPCQQHLSITLHAGCSTGKAVDVGGVVSVAHWPRHLEAVQQQHLLRHLLARPLCHLRDLGCCTSQCVEVGKCCHCPLHPLQHTVLLSPCLVTHALEFATTSCNVLLRMHCKMMHRAGLFCTAAVKFGARCAAAADSNTWHMPLRAACGCLGVVLVSFPFNPLHPVHGIDHTCTDASTVLHCGVTVPFCTVACSMLPPPS